MRRYESVWVVNGDLPDEEVKSAIDKFSRIISSQGGTLVGVDEWGRRKLAYKIQGTVRGYYVLADFAGTSETVNELERNYRIDDRIIRYLTTKKSDQVDLEALQAEIAARAKAAEPEPEPEPQPEVQAEPEAQPEAAAGAAETGAPAEAAAPAEPAAPAQED
ncbi:MAG: 30S ribosomal protein S6 [Deltaproteobacteria bacterium]|jgi:small subunit ribosomal protein S6